MIYILLLTTFLLSGCVNALKYPSECAFKNENAAGQKTGPDYRMPCKIDRVDRGPVERTGGP